MRATEASGRSVDEAISRALGEIGAAREDVEVEILQEPKPALLGLGGREARVRVTRREAAGAIAWQISSEILGLMGYNATAEAQETTEGVVLTLDGQDLGGLIGRHGQTLDALEFLVGLRLARRLGHRVHVIIDAEGYRARREKALQKIASEAADRAVRERRPVFLEPTDPRDRRTVHLALQHDPRVTTSSIGEDDDRRVVVHPRGLGGLLPEDALPPDEIPPEE